MNLEDKHLLISDLSARIPNMIHCAVYKMNGDILEEDDIIYYMAHESVVTLKHLSVNECFMIYQIKPYLRPLSSMTEEEYNKLNWKGCSHVINYSSKTWFSFVSIKSFTLEVLNFLISNHFDFRGLIDKGLALPAPDEMYSKN